MALGVYLSGALPCCSRSSSTAPWMRRMHADHSGVSLRNAVPCLAVTAHSLEDTAIMQVGCSVDNLFQYAMRTQVLSPVHVLLSLPVSHGQLR